MPTEGINLRAGYQAGPPTEKVYVALESKVSSLADPPPEAGYQFAPQEALPDMEDAGAPEVEEIGADIQDSGNLEKPLAHDVSYDSSLFKESFVNPNADGRHVLNVKIVRLKASKLTKQSANSI